MQVSHGHPPCGLGGATAQDEANYRVSSATDPSYQAPQAPLLASLRADGRTVSLTINDPLKAGHSYTLTVDNVRDLAGNAVATGSSIAFALELETVALSVNAGVEIRPFNPMMRGAQLACWMHEQANKPGPDSVLNLSELTEPLSPGILRYCGGLWSNSVGWDRSGQQPRNGTWQWTDPDSGQLHSFVYSHAYRPEWIDNLASFLEKVGAAAMIQANLCDDNPKMWADLVRYANVERGYGFRYWELSNEIDLKSSLRQKCFGTTDQAVAAQAYAQRFVEYSIAMKAVDPTIRIIGPATANYFSADTWIPPLVAAMEAAGLELDVLSWHWYQVFDWVSDPNTQAYDFASLEALLNYNTAITDLNWPYKEGDVITDPDHWLYRSRRVFAEHTAQDARLYAPSYPNVELAVTESNAHGADYDLAINGNHLGAVWMADIMGRYAYHGLDIRIWYELYDGGPDPTDVSYGMVYPDNDVSPSKLFVRPSYYTMLMYAQWFGDTMVQTATSDPLQNTVVWASKDGDEPNALKLCRATVASSLPRLPMRPVPRTCWSPTQTARAAPWPGATPTLRRPQRRT